MIHLHRKSNDENKCNGTNWMSAKHATIKCWAKAFSDGNLEFSVDAQMD